MTLEEKQIIAATARKLINQLENCDDDLFVDLIIDSIISNNDYLIQAERI